MNEPPKFYYNYNDNELVTATGSKINNKSFFPNATLGGKYTINFQLVFSDNEKYTGLSQSTSCEFVVDSDYQKGSKKFGFTADSWTKDTATNEYYVKVDYDPISVLFNDIEAIKGSKGSLNQGEYDYSDQKLYIRLDADQDPTTLADNYITGVFQGSENSTNPMILCQSENFNLSNSWFDTETETYRDPILSQGELTFIIDATTLDFFMKIGTGKDTTPFAQIDFYIAGEYSLSKNMSFTCYNRLFEGDELAQAQEIEYSYSKAESDSRFVQISSRPINGVGYFLTLNALELAFPVANEGDFAFVNESGASPVQYIWDVAESKWSSTGDGIGDMKAEVYDPNGKNSDAFDMDNMSEGTDNKLFTAADQTKLNKVPDYLGTFETFTANDNTSTYIVVGDYTASRVITIDLWFTDNTNYVATEIDIVHDNSACNLNIVRHSQAVDIAGVTFSADISGNDIRLILTSTGTGTAVNGKYTITNKLPV